MVHILSQVSLFLLVFAFAVAQNYYIKLRNVECKNVDTDYVKNVTCYIKAVRKMMGVLYTEYTFVKAPNVIYELKTFSRNSHGHYQPFLMDLELDICKVNKMLPSFDFGVKKWVSLTFTRNFPAFWKGCPVSGTMSVKESEWNGGYKHGNDEVFIQSHKMMPIIPTGDFVIVSRFSNGKTNKSYIDVNIFITIQRANRKAIDLSFLNMG